MGQIFNIIQGWARYISGATLTEKEFQRSEICKACDFAEEGTFEEWLPETGLKEVHGLKCSKCTCPLVAKIRSEREECPLNKW